MHFRDFSSVKSMFRVLRPTWQSWTRDEFQRSIYKQIFFPCQFFGRRSKIGTYSRVSNKRTLFLSRKFSPYAALVSQAGLEAAFQGGSISNYCLTQEIFTPTPAETVLWTIAKILLLLKSKFYKKRGATFFYDFTRKLGPLDFTQYRSKSSSF